LFSSFKQSPTLASDLPSNPFVYLALSLMLTLLTFQLLEGMQPAAFFIFSADPLSFSSRWAPPLAERSFVLYPPLPALSPGPSLLQPSSSVVLMNFPRLPSDLEGVVFFWGGGGFSRGSPRDAPPPQPFALFRSGREPR